MSSSYSGEWCEADRCCQRPRLRHRRRRQGISSCHQSTVLYPGDYCLFYL